MQEGITLKPWPIGASDNPASKAQKAFYTDQSIRCPGDMLPSRVKLFFIFEADAMVSVNYDVYETWP